MLIIDQMDALFEASGLRDYLGTLVNTIVLEPEGARVGFTLDLQMHTNVSEEEILQACENQLTGRDNNVILPNNIIIKDLFNVTVPGRDHSLTT